MLSQRANHFEGLGFAKWAVPYLLAFMRISVASGGHEFVTFSAFLRLDDLNLLQNGRRHGLSGRFRGTFHHNYAVGVI